MASIILLALARLFCACVQCTINTVPVVKYNWIFHVIQTFSFCVCVFMRVRKCMCD